MFSDEKTQLGENVAYLDKYDRFATWRGMQLFDADLRAIVESSKTMDSNFDAIEAKEMEVSQHIGEILGSDAFQSLAKMLEADEYVQKASADFHFCILLTRNTKVTTSVC